MILMVKLDNGKFKTYKLSDIAIAQADARDYNSVVEYYQILGDGRFDKL